MHLLNTEFDRSELTLCGSRDVKIQFLLLERVRTHASLLQRGFSLLKRQTSFSLSPGKRATTVVLTPSLPGPEVFQATQCALYAQDWKLPRLLPSVLLAS